MRILYYSWDESNAMDLEECLKEKNNIVDKISFSIQDKLNDLSFARYMEKLLQENVYDCIFSFDFFPIISKVANTYGVKYISWVYDSPNLTLYSKAVFNECNFIFCFDKAETLKLKAYGIQNIYHMPLAVNTKRLQSTLKDRWDEKKYQYEVSFLGNLYNNEYNFFDQIKNVPQYYKGFFDALINTQMNLYGVDLVPELITEERYQEIKKFVPIQLCNEMFIEEKNIFENFLQKKITNIERTKILEMISKKYSITHFAAEKNFELTKVDFGGYANYITDMPLIFCDSKINLNITLRSIISGIPLRCLDVMGAGGFLLSNYQPELSEYFIEGKEFVIYEDREDLMNKIEYYLSHEKEREEIAYQGRKKIEEEFTYEQQLRKIFTIVFEN